MTNARIVVTEGRMDAWLPLLGLAAKALPFAAKAGSALMSMAPGVISSAGRFVGGLMGSQQPQQQEPVYQEPYQDPYYQDPYQQQWDNDVPPQVKAVAGIPAKVLATPAVEKALSHAAVKAEEASKAEQKAENVIIKQLESAVVSKFNIKHEPVRLIIKPHRVTIEAAVISPETVTKDDIDAFLPLLGAAAGMIPGGPGAIVGGIKKLFGKKKKRRKSKAAPAPEPENEGEGSSASPASSGGVSKEFVKNAISSLLSEVKEMINERPAAPAPVETRPPDNPSTTS